MVTVVASILVLARYDPELVGERSATPWLSFVELAAAVVMVAGTWAVRATHPRASTGLAVATAGSLLPLWAASSWLPGPVRAGVLAAAPLTVAGVAQVALGWPTDVPPAARRAGQAIFALAGAAGLAHLLGYNPFADPGCFRTCEDVPPLLGGSLTTQTAVTITSLLTIVAAAVATAAILAARTARTPRSVTGAVVVALAALAISAATRLVGWGDALASVSGSPRALRRGPRRRRGVRRRVPDGADPSRHGSVGGPAGRPGGGAAPAVASSAGSSSRCRTTGAGSTPPAATSVTHRHRAATWSCPMRRDRCSVCCWPGVPTRARSSPG